MISYTTDGLIIYFTANLPRGSGQVWYTCPIIIAVQSHQLTLFAYRK